jgi:hypothetical protein
MPLIGSIRVPAATHAEGDGGVRVAPESQCVARVDSVDDACRHTPSGAPRRPGRATRRPISAGRSA